jgi:TPR repeat protein
MSPEQHQRVRKLFDEVTDLPESERLSFLKRECGEDTEVYEVVARLLEAQAGASPIDEAPHCLKRIGRYLITGELGRGGMGVVYDAIDPKIDRAVAVKVIHMESLGDPQKADFLRDRLFREARSAGRLSHPGIVTIFDADQEGQLAFIAMERVEGPSLHRILGEGRELSSAQIFETLRQTAAALDYAHSRKVVHCDVKPANLMIAAGWTVKLTDFGIAKITSTEYHTRTGLLMGTPSYMSPEQIEGRTLDGRSDQFSLAALAFRLLAGTTPFRGDSLAAVGYAIVNGPRPSAAAVNPRLAQGVDHALGRGLAKSPEERFPSCADFVRALEAARAEATATLTSQAKRAEVPSTQAMEAGKAPIPYSRRRFLQMRGIGAGVVGALLLAGLGYWTLTGRHAPPAVFAPAVLNPTATLYAQAVRERRAGHAEAAFELFHQAAEQGDVLSMVELGKMLANGEGAPQDNEQAAGWFRRAGEGGSADAMLQLGGLYYFGGQGVRPDLAAAAEWFQRASDLGVAAAKFDLCDMYEKGLGVPKDLDRARRFCQDAAALGQEDARKRLSRLPGPGR